MCIVSALLASPNLIAWLFHFMYLHQILVRPLAWWWNAGNWVPVFVWYMGFLFPIALLVPAILNSLRKNVAWYQKLFPWIMFILSIYGYNYVKHNMSEPIVGRRQVAIRQELSHKHLPPRSGSDDLGQMDSGSKC
jgi:hypothetical protein